MRILTVEIPHFTSKSISLVAKINQFMRHAQPAAIAASEILSLARLDPTMRASTSDSGYSPWRRERHLSCINDPKVRSFLLT